MKGGLQRIRDLHDVPAKYGGRVKYTAPPGGLELMGTITGAREGITGALWLRVRMDELTFPISCHPTQYIKYLPEGEK